MFKYTTHTPNAYTNQISNELIATVFHGNSSQK